MGEKSLKKWMEGVVGYWEKPSEEEEAEGGRKEERQLSALSFKFSSSRKGKKIFEFSFQMCRWVFLNLEQLVVMYANGSARVGSWLCLAEGVLQAECPSFHYSLVGDPSAKPPLCTALMTEVLCGSCHWAGVCRPFLLDSCHLGSHN